MRIISALGIGHAVAMRKRNRTFAQAFQHDRVQFSAFDQIDRRVEPVRRETRAGADAVGCQAGAPRA
jgi:hypothetical protein